MLTADDVREALRVCFDPELHTNVVDLGRVWAIHVDRDTEAPGTEPRAHVRIELLRYHEEQDAMLAGLIANRLLGMYEISRADVTLVESPTWSPDRMTASARREVGRQRGLIQLGDAF